MSAPHQNRRVASASNPAPAPLRPALRTSERTWPKPGPNAFALKELADKEAADQQRLRANAFYQQDYARQHNIAMEDIHKFVPESHPVALSSTNNIHPVLRSTPNLYQDPQPTLRSTLEGRQELRQFPKPGKDSEGIPVFQYSPKPDDKSKKAISRNKIYDRIKSTLNFTGKSSTPSEEIVVAPKAAAVLGTPHRMRAPSMPGHTPTKKTRFSPARTEVRSPNQTMSLNRRTQKVDLPPMSPMQHEPRNATPGRSGRAQTAAPSSLARSKSLNDGRLPYYDDTSPPTPPTKDTPPRGKSRSDEKSAATPVALRHRRSRSLDEPSPTKPGVVYYSGDRLSPAKQGGYGYKDTPRIVEQASVQSMHAEVASIRANKGMRFANGVMDENGLLQPGDRLPPTSYDHPYSPPDYERKPHYDSSAYTESESGGFPRSSNLVSSSPEKSLPKQVTFADAEEYRQLIGDSSAAFRKSSSDTTLSSQGRANTEDNGDVTGHFDSLTRSPTYSSEQSMNINECSWAQVPQLDNLTDNQVRREWSVIKKQFGIRLPECIVGDAPRSEDLSAVPSPLRVHNSKMVSGSTTNDGRATSAPPARGIGLGLAVASDSQGSEPSLRERYVEDSMPRGHRLTPDEKFDHIIMRLNTLHAYYDAMYKEQKSGDLVMKLTDTLSDFSTMTTHQDALAENQKRANRIQRDVLDGVERIHNLEEAIIEEVRMWDEDLKALRDLSDKSHAKLETSQQDALAVKTQLTAIEATLRNISMLFGKVSAMADTVPDLDTGASSNLTSSSSSAVSTRAPTSGFTALVSAVAQLDSTRTDLASLHTTLSSLDTKMDTLHQTCTDTNKEVSFLSGNLAMLHHGIGMLHNQMSKLAVVPQRVSAVADKQQALLGRMGGLEDVVAEVVRKLDGLSIREVEAEGTADAGTNTGAAATGAAAAATAEQGTGLWGSPKKQ